jgi:AraC-like DNA-binding protein
VTSPRAPILSGPTRPAETPLAQTVRPGLILCGGTRALVLAPPPDTVACLVYDLDAAKMSLHRAPPPDEAAPGFRAAIFLSLAATEELFANDTSAGAAHLRRFAAGEGGSFSHPLTPRARLALESLRHCPFAGACRAMALTARCHDLLVELLVAWTESLQPAPTAIGPSDRVRVAAEILERDLEAPPSLAELATRVGLSETTLKRGFPQVYGDTVFGYVRARRMEKARRLLESGAATVLEAAAHVGYSNPSNFAAAFRQQFGVNPKTFQLRARRSG